MRHLAFVLAWLATTLLACPVVADVTQGYAPLLRATKQVPVENLPPQAVKVGTSTYLSTGTETYTRTGTLTNGTSTGIITATRATVTLGNGYLYGANGIGFVATNTLTTTASYTRTTTATIPVTQTTTAHGTGNITASASTTGTGTETQSVTALFPDLFTATYTGTPPTTTGTSTRTNSRTYTTTVTVTLASTLTTTASATGTGTGTATGTGTGTGTVSGSATGTQTASGTTTVSVTGSGATTETVSNTQTFLGTTMTVTGTKTWTASRSQVATATQSTISTTATGTGTGTWTNTNTATTNSTETATTSNTFTVTTTSNSAGIDVGPTIVPTNRAPGGAYMVDIDGCQSVYGICPITKVQYPSSSPGVARAIGITSSSGIVEITTPHYEPGAWYVNYAAERMVWPVGTWTMRVRSEASSLRYRSFIRAEVVVYGKHKPTGTYPDGQQSCAGNVDSVVPTGLIMDFPVIMEGGGGRLYTMDAFVGGPSASVEQSVSKNFYFEPNSPSGWNTQCTTTSGSFHPPVHPGIRISAYTESPDPVDIYFYTADLDSPVPAMP